MNQSNQYHAEPGKRLPAIISRGMPGRCTVPGTYYPPFRPHRRQLTIEQSIDRMLERTREFDQDGRDSA